jgi:hypothetical protein
MRILCENYWGIFAVANLDDVHGKVGGVPRKTIADMIK